MPGGPVSRGTLIPGAARGGGLPLKPGFIPARRRLLVLATPPNAIVFSSGWITIPRMFRAGVALDVMALAIIPAMIYFLGRMVLGIG